MLVKKTILSLTTIGFLIGLVSCNKQVRSEPISSIQPSSISSNESEEKSEATSPLQSDSISSDEEETPDKYFDKYSLSLNNADVIPDGKYVGSSKVDEFFTSIENGDLDAIKPFVNGQERFFIAFVEENSESCSNLYNGLKMFQECFGKNEEFKNLDGSFELVTIYVDSISKKDNETNLFDIVWTNHYSLFEEMSRSSYLANTYYAKNKGYSDIHYLSSFTADESAKECPMSVPLLMYFDYTEANPISQQYVRGLSDVIFSVDGSSNLDKAHTLKDCWSHSGIFGEENN